MFRRYFSKKQLNIFHPFLSKIFLLSSRKRCKAFIFRVAALIWNNCVRLPLVVCLLQITLIISTGAFEKGDQKALSKTFPFGATRSDNRHVIADLSNAEAAVNVLDATSSHLHAALDNLRLDISNDSVSCV